MTSGTRIISVWTAARKGIEVIGGMHKWVMPCNWKFPAENFGGDAYHVPWSHLSAVKTDFSTGVSTKADTTGAMVSPGNGHILICVGPNDVGDPPMPEILEYEKRIRPEVEARLGARSRLINPIVGTMFPNFSMLRATSRTFRVWHPRGPDKTEVWSWVYALTSGAAARQGGDPAGRHPRGFSPAGTFEQDDMDNWQECTLTCRGTMSRRLAVNTQMGLGHERFDDGLQAWASDFRMSESNHRQFYRRWAQLMTAESWDAVPRSNGWAESSRT